MMSLLQKHTLELQQEQSCTTLANSTISVQPISPNAFFGANQNCACGGQPRPWQRSCSNEFFSLLLEPQTRLPRPRISPWERSHSQCLTMLQKLFPNHTSTLVTGITRGVRTLVHQPSNVLKLHQQKLLQLMKKVAAMIELWHGRCHNSKSEVLWGDAIASAAIPTKNEQIQKYIPGQQDQHVSNILRYEHGFEDMSERLALDDTGIPDGVPDNSDLTALTLRRDDMSRKGVIQRWENTQRLSHALWN
eukprot:6255857-Amphidinium_carterae.1